MAELLLELYSEEIPAGMQVRAAEELKTALKNRLTLEDIKTKSIETYVTPQRLIAVVGGLPTEIKASSAEKRGPRIDAPEQAIEGFLKSTGLKKNQLEKRKTQKGEFYFAVTKQDARSIDDDLVVMLQDIISSFSWPKSMRWGGHTIRWVRPLHNILCIFNKKTLPVKFGHLKANNKTRGHRFLHNKEITVEEFKDYQSQLEKAKVIVCFEERKKQIEEQAKEVASTYGLDVKEDIGLLNEVAGLVEWPNALIGKIDKRFMSMPEEVLVTTMRSHQKYFSTLDKEGKLAPYFITIANITTNGENKNIVVGNERVLNARLEDALFFWKQDRKVPLEERLPQLEKIVFHAKLGTVAEKTDRIAALAKLLAVWVPHANLMLVERAAHLCKADLTTEMVNELPELQGLIGAYYAVANKEEKDVALAIKEHYSPLGPNDACPTNPLSVAIALADKIDSLVGLFSVNEKPTGSRDPYALRRAALGVIRIIIENRLRTPLKLLFEKSIGAYPKALLKPEKSDPVKEKTKHKSERVISELLSFFADRIRVALKEQNIRYDLINAVFDEGKEDDIFRLILRVKALETFLKTKNGENLLAAYKRATNIVLAEEKKDKEIYKGQPKKELLEQVEEIELYSMFEALKPKVEKDLKEDMFEEAMEDLAQMRAIVDKFFDNVTVNCDKKETRKNRLLLLSQFREILNQVANFNKIEQ